jgi:hypothetical protein
MEAFLVFQQHHHHKVGKFQLTDLKEEGYKEGKRKSL